MSPELLDPEMFGLKMCLPTKESDCYALGMVIYEVLSGRMPFTSYTAPVVIWKVLNGERPKRPQGSDGELFTDSVWRVVEHCWKPQPHDRISADAVLLGLERNLSPLRPSFKAGGDAGPGSSYQQNNTVAGDCMFSPIHLRLAFDPLCAV
jgi:serine/threonine protein kinase